jgi:hypothetical protein
MVIKMTKWIRTPSIDGNEYYINYNLVNYVEYNSGSAILYFANEKTLTLKITKADLENDLEVGSD